MATKSSHHCICCNRPLTNPVSQALGKGPICRMGGKKESMNRLSLFSMEAIFSWGFLRPTDPKYKKSIIWIQDDSGQEAAKSVTNDMDNVLMKIDAEVRDITRCKDHRDGLGVREFLTMYRDTDGVWDGIDITEYKGGYKFPATPFSLNLKTRDVAALKLWDVRGRVPKEKKGIIVITEHSHDESPV